MWTHYRPSSGSLSLSGSPSLCWRYWSSHLQINAIVQENKYRVDTYPSLELSAVQDSNRDVQDSNRDVQESNRDVQESNRDVQESNRDVQDSNRDVQESNRDVQEFNRDVQHSNRASWEENTAHVLLLE
ncbi:chitin biosynthesis protein CHS5-like [Tachysurus fulvidraco]|uniref:chitin biosynthesis protein CHS5-like n=1 Tax=Tachysurus fulvidraco TaxID=1234273 RepID=UPI001FF02A53|nr:chitin biosynthesis protein CHS5-like [Tachysurus fulvidraco]